MCPPSTVTIHNFKRFTMTIGMCRYHWLLFLLKICAASQVLPPSPREHPVRGLQLIRLLTQNRIADFHTALEGLPISSEQVAADEYLSHPVRLERWLMEGSYAKVWSAREDAPTDEYEFFVDELMGTIRFVSLLYRCSICLV
jgi:hypothetical protein